MPFRIIVQPEAKLDIQEGIAYYRSISPSLAEKFLKQVNAAFNDLKSTPFYEIRYDNVRMKKVKVVPYVIHFIVEEESEIIRIYDVRFGIRDPPSSWFFREEAEEYVAGGYLAEK